MPSVNCHYFVHSLMMLGCGQHSTNICTGLVWFVLWWRYEMKSFLHYPPFVRGNHQSSEDSPIIRPVMWSFKVYLLLNKQSSCIWKRHDAQSNVLCSYSLWLLRFNHMRLRCFVGIGVIVWWLQFQWRNSEECEHRQISNIRRTLVANKIVDHSDVVGASPVGAAPTTSSFST